MQDAQDSTCYLSKALLDQALRRALGGQQAMEGLNLLANGSGASLARGRCDSSDCLYCQYSEDCSLHTSSAPGKLCTLLRKRSLSGVVHRLECGTDATSTLSRPGSSGPLQESVPSPTNSLRRSDGSEHAFRRQRTSGDDGGWADVSANLLQDQLLLSRNEAQQTSAARSSTQSVPQQALQTQEDRHEALLMGWKFEDHCEGMEEPAPAQLAQLARLGLPSHRVSHDMICAMEFSGDGRLLATGSMAKQVRLYSLSELFDNQWQEAVPYHGNTNGVQQNGSSHSQSDSLRDVPDEELGKMSEDSMDSLDELDQDDSGDSSSRQASPAVQSADGPRSRYRRRSRSMPNALRECLAPVAVHRLPSKVSCLAWSQGMDGVVVVGDYDGVITQLHVCTGHQLSDVDAHAGRRIWGVATSPLQPQLVASVSDDCTARIWSGPCLDTCAAIIRPPSLAPCQRLSRSLCGVDFSSHDPNLIALASADHTVYLYDIRSTATHLAALQHHQRPVSYVKFFGSGQLVSASTDASLAIWDLSDMTLQQSMPGQPHGHSHNSAHLSSHQRLQQQSALVNGTDQQQLASCMAGNGYVTLDTAPRHLQPHKILAGHKNEKNFVGLAVRPEDGLLACGSETSSVFAYHRAWSTPLASMDLCARRGLGSRNKGSTQLLRINSNPHVSSMTESSNPLPSGQQQSNPVSMQSGNSSHSHALRKRTAHSPFVSSVAWQSASAAAVLGLPAILAAGTSSGDVSLLMLQQP